MYNTVSGSDLSAMSKKKPGKEDWVGGWGKWHGILQRVKREDAEKDWLFVLLTIFPNSFGQRTNSGKKNIPSIHSSWHSIFDSGTKAIFLGLSSACS